MSADLDQLSQEFGQQAGGSPAPAPKKPAVDLGQLSQEFGSQHAAPVSAPPVGNPPTLPPVSAATPGIAPPAATPAPAVTPPVPQKPPGYLDVNWQNKAANPALKNVKPTLSDAQAMLGETGIDVAAFPPPTGPVPRYKPLSFPKSPTADAEARLHQAEAKLAKLPAYMQGAFQAGHGPIAPDKAYQPAEGGAVEKLREAHGLAARDAGAAALRAHGQALSLANEATSRLNTLIEYANKNGGSLSDKEQADLAGQITQANKDYGQAKQNFEHVDKLAKRFQPYVDKFSTTPPHSGMLYPGEPGADRQDAPALIKAAGGLLAPNAMAHAKEYEQNRVALMLSGQYPKLPTPPKGMDPDQAIREKNRVIMWIGELRRAERGLVGNESYEQGKKRLMPALTPWQRQLLPVIEKQLNAEQIAAAGQNRALAIDVAAQAAGGVAGHLAGGLVARGIGQLAAGRGAQLLEQSVVQALERGGVQQGVKTGLAQAGAGTLTGLAAGGVTGATASGVGTLLSTGNPQKALKAAKTSLGPSAIIGGIFGLGASLGQNAWGLLRGSKPLPPEVAASQAQSVSQELSRQMGLSPEETGALAQRLEELNLERNPLKRNHLGRQLYDDLRFHGARRAAATTPGAAPEGGAVVPHQPQAEPIPVGGTLPGEQPVTSPTGAAGGFIGPRITTPAGEKPLRTMSAAELEQTRQQAVATGDTATAARAQQGLDLHAKHQAMDQPLPLEESKAYLKDRNRPGNVPIAQSRVIASHAAAIEKTNPDLSQRLQQAADDYEKVWKNDWLSVGGKVLTTPEAAAPPQVSVWRQLNPTEQSSLPTAVKQALLVQDVHNSQQALTPGAPAIFRTSDVPGKPKSAKALEATADQMFGQAEAHLDSAMPAPAVASPVAETVASPESPAAITEPVAAPPSVALPSPGNTAPQEYAGPERRTPENAPRRKAIEEMSHAEAVEALKTNPMTGLKGRRPWEDFYGYEDQSGVFHPGKWYDNGKQEHLIATDADSLKFFNDKFGHGAGDAVLRAIGDAIREVGLGDDFYHVSGDEFNGKTADTEDAGKRLAKADEWLREHTVRFKDKDGVEHVVKGVGLSYAIGEKGENFKSIDERLKGVKAEREAAGVRGARGEQPPHFAEVAGSTGQAPREAAPHGGEAPAKRVGGANEEVRSVVPRKPATVPASVKARLPTYGSYQEAQDAIDDYETELEKKHGPDSIMPSGMHLLPAADRERLGLMYEARDQIGAAGDKADVDRAMSTLRPESTAFVPAPAVRKAIAELQKQHGLMQALGHKRTQKRAELAHKLYVSLSHAAANEGLLPRDFAGDPELAASVAAKWPNTDYGVNPQPLLDQVNSLVDDLLGTAPPPKEKAAERPAQRALPASPKKAASPGRYHGASSPVKLGMVYDREQHQNLYGPGFYTTDNLEIGQSYTKKGSGKEPSLYRVEWVGKKPPALLDLEKPLPADVHDIFAGEYGDVFTDKLDFSQPGKAIYRELKEAWAYDHQTTDEVQEKMHGIADDLEKKGYDGYSHIGGRKDSSIKHNVVIYFHPVDPDTGEPNLKLIPANPETGEVAPTEKPQPQEERSSDSGMAVSHYSFKVGAEFRDIKTGDRFIITKRSPSAVDYKVTMGGRQSKAVVGEERSADISELATRVQPIGEAPTPPGFRKGAFKPFVSTAQAGPQPIRTNTEVDRIFDEGYVPPKVKDENAPNPVETLINSFTRQFPHLPETAPNIKLKGLLTDQERSKALAQGKALRHVEKVFHSLHPQEVKNFSHVMFAKDLESTLDHFQAEWVDAGKDIKDFDATQFLPDGINESDVRTAAKAVDQILKAQPHLNSLAIKLRTLRKAIVDPWLDNYEAVFGRRPKLDNPWYVRHVVRTALGEQGIPSGAGGGLASKSISPIKGRTGTQLLHASNIVESEMDVIQRVVRHDLRLQLVRHLEENYDKMPVYMASQAAAKDPDLLKEIASVAGSGAVTPTLQATLGKMASDEMAPDLLNGKHAQAITDLHLHYDLNKERAANGLPPIPMDADAEKRVIDYVKWLHGQIVKHGKVGAQIPKGYELVDVTGLPTYYQAYTINERLARQAIEDGLTDLNVPVDKIRKVLAVGRRRQMLLPSEVARTLKHERFGEPDPIDSILRSVTRSAMGKLKGWLIYGPQNYMSQLIRNGIGDTLRILRNAPGMVARIEEGKVRSAWIAAFKDLADNRVMFKPPSPELEKFYDLGGEEALHYASEDLASPHPLSPVSRHMGKQSPIRKLGAVAQWAYLLPHDFREQWGRYAVYRYVLDYTLKHGKPPVIGSAKAEQALAIKDPHEQAFFIANHIVGAYNQRSAATRMLRRFPLPFFSFQEINASGIYHEIKNRINAPDVAHSLGRQWIGEGRIPNWMAKELTRGAAMFGGLLGLGLFTGLALAYNRMKHPKEQEELNRTMPGDSAIIAGSKDDAGNIPIYRGMDPVRDLADKLLGVSTALEERQDLLNGRKTPQEFILDLTAKNWANQLYQQLNPALKPYDIAGYSTFPNVFEMRPNKITADAIWDQAGLGGAYRYLNHIPQKRGYREKLLQGKNTVNPLELSYWQAQDGVRNWQERVGKKPPEIGGGATDDPQVQALYWVKQAERLGDRAGAIYWLGKYARAQQGRAEGSVGGSLKTLQNATEGLDPLHSVTDKDLMPYLRQLKPEEAWALRRAYLFYHNLVAPDMALHGMENLSTVSYVRRMRGMMKNAILRSEILKGAPEGGELKRRLRKNEGLARKRLPVTPDASGASGMDASELENEISGSAP